MWILLHRGQMTCTHTLDWLHKLEPTIAAAGYPAIGALESVFVASGECARQDLRPAAPGAWHLPQWTFRTLVYPQHVGPERLEFSHTALPFAIHRAIGAGWRMILCIRQVLRLQHFFAIPWARNWSHGASFLVSMFLFKWQLVTAIITGNWSQLTGVLLMSITHRHVISRISVVSHFLGNDKTCATPSSAPYCRWLLDLAVVVGIGFVTSEAIFHLCHAPAARINLPSRVLILGQHASNVVWSSNSHYVTSTDIDRGRR